MVLCLLLGLLLGDLKTEVGAALPPFTLPDQYGTPHAFEKGTRWVLISYEKKIAARVNEWLQKKPATYLGEHKTTYIVEISPMPQIIADKLAKPKMRKYPHRVLIADDAAYRQTYPYRDGMATAIRLDAEGVVQEIRFSDKVAELEQWITAP